MNRPTLVFTLTVEEAARNGTGVWAVYTIFCCEAPVIETYADEDAAREACKKRCSQGDRSTVYHYSAEEVGEFILNLGTKA